jgi:hypothetical protein
MAEKNLPRRFLDRFYGWIGSTPVYSWLPYVVISALTIAVSIWLQWGTSGSFANGDSYIHLAYAKNLVTRQELTYNPGIYEGIGTSSILWTFVLAAIHKFQENPILWARIFGVGLLVLGGCLVYELTWQVLRRHASRPKRILAMGIAMLAMLSGNIVWAAQSGMETILFVALGLMALKAYGAGHRFLLGIVLGLLVLTRIEGVLLVGAVFLIDLLHKRRISSSILKTAAPIALLVLPWVGYLQWREGTPTTNSMNARNFYMKEVNERIAGEFPKLAWIFNTPVILYVVSWIVFLVIYSTGLTSLLGPAAEVHVSELATTLDVSLPGVTIGLIISLALGANAIHWLWSERRLLSLKNVEDRMLLILGLWMALHNLAYALFLPRFGGGGRYAPFNTMLYWVLLGMGAFAFMRRRLRIVGVGCVALLMAFSLNYWKDVYFANTDNLTNVREAAAHYIDEQLPPDRPIGAVDIGVQRYFAQQQVIDLAGHINPEVLTYWDSEGGVSDYLLDKQICHISIQGPVDGVGLDMAHSLGLDIDDRFDLVPEIVFATPVEQWKRGVGSLLYMPATYVYRIQWHDQTFCDDVLPSTQGS